jgi:pilus assembly protein CpaB
MNGTNAKSAGDAASARNTKATLGAIGCALLGAGALHVYLGRYEQEVAGGAPQAVVVSTRDLELGEVLSRASLDFRDLPERYIEERHIAAEDLERVIGTRVTGAVRSGATLLWTDLDVAQEGRTLSGLVQSGMRAFTLPEGEVSFDGLLRPGDRADVLFTRADADTITLLQNVLVLTVGSDLGADVEPSTAHSASSGRVTLSVTLEQAQRLAQSEGRGALRLALRNPQDLVLADVPLPTGEGDLVRGPRGGRAAP